MQTDKRQEYGICSLYESSSFSTTLFLGMISIYKQLTTEIDRFGPLRFDGWIGMRQHKIELPAIIVTYLLIVERQTDCCDKTMKRLGAHWKIQDQSRKVELLTREFRDVICSTTSKTVILWAKHDLFAPRNTKPLLFYCQKLDPKRKST